MKKLLLLILYLSPILAFAQQVKNINPTWNADYPFQNPTDSLYINWANKPGGYSTIYTGQYLQNYLFPQTQTYTQKVIDSVLLGQKLFNTLNLVSLPISTGNFVTYKNGKLQQDTTKYADLKTVDSIANKSTSYIKNQNSGPQSGSFWVNGMGKFSNTADSSYLQFNPNLITGSNKDAQYNIGGNNGIEYSFLKANSGFYLTPNNLQFNLNQGQFQVNTGGFFYGITQSSGNSAGFSFVPNGGMQQTLNDGNGNSTHFGTSQGNLGFTTNEGNNSVSLSVNTASFNFNTLTPSYSNSLEMTDGIYWSKNSTDGTTNNTLVLNNSNFAYNGLSSGISSSFSLSPSSFGVGTIDKYGNGFIFGLTEGAFYININEGGDSSHQTTTISGLQLGQNDQLFDANNIPYLKATDTTNLVTPYYLTHKNLIYKGQQAFTQPLVIDMGNDTTTLSAVELHLGGYGGGIKYTSNGIQDITGNYQIKFGDPFEFNGGGHYDFFNGNINIVHFGAASDDKLNWTKYGIQIGGAKPNTCYALQGHIAQFIGTVSGHDGVTDSDFVTKRQLIAAVPGGGTGTLQSLNAGNGLSGGTYNGNNTITFSVDSSKFVTTYYLTQGSPNFNNGAIFNTGSTLFKRGFRSLGTDTIGQLLITQNLNGPSNVINVPNTPDGMMAVHGGLVNTFPYIHFGLNNGLVIGNIGGGNSAAVFVASSTTGGIMFPQMTAAQRDAILVNGEYGSDGDQVYQTDGTPGLYTYFGAHVGWIRMATINDVPESYQSPISITSTGNSGAATFTSNVLNIPIYTLAGLGGEPTLSGSGYVKKLSGITSYVTAIPNTDLANNTISGVSLGGTLANLSFGRGFSGGIYNGGTGFTAFLDTTKTYTWIPSQTFASGFTFGNNILPSANNTYNLGSGTYRLANIYTSGISSVNAYFTKLSTNGTGLLFNNNAGTSNWGQFIESTGNLLLGNQSSTSYTDGGYKLDIQTAGSSGYFRAGTALTYSANQLTLSSGNITLGASGGIGEFVYGVTNSNYNSGFLYNSARQFANTGLYGVAMHIQGATYTDNATAASSTQNWMTQVSMYGPPVAAINTGITYNNAATLYINGAPVSSTNVTITNPYSLYINGGISYLGGDVIHGGNILTNSNNTYSIGSGTTAFSAAYTNKIQSAANTSLTIATGSSSQPTVFFQGGTEMARFASTSGNLLFGSTTDGGYKMDVQASGTNGYFRLGSTFAINNSGNLTQTASSTFGTSTLSPSVVGVAGGVTTNNAGSTTGRLFSVGTGVITRTADAGTVNGITAASSFGTPTYATSSSTTYPTAATLYIDGAPVAGTNTAITNPYALYINSGVSRLSGLRLDMGSDATGDMFYRGTNGTFNRLPIGSSGQILTTSAGIPSWQNGTNYLSGRTAVTDANYTQTSSDYLIAYTALTAPRSVTLLAINDKQTVVIKDESGNAATNNITVNAPAGKYIDGAASKTINTNMGLIKLYYQASSGNYFTY